MRVVSPLHGRRPAPYLQRVVFHALEEISVPQRQSFKNKNKKKRLTREAGNSSKFRTSVSAVSAQPRVSASASAVSGNLTVPSSCTSLTVSRDTVTHSLPREAPSSMVYLTGESNAATLALSTSVIAACVTLIPSGFVPPVTLFSGVSLPGKTKSS